MTTRRSSSRERWGDLTVLELSGSIAGAFAGRQFRELGATCIVAEDASEAGQPSDLRSDAALFAYLNAGKQSIVLPEPFESRMELLGRLAARADVVLRGPLAPPVKQAWNERMAGLPRTIEVIVSPFGADGPLAHYRGDSGAVLALSGLTYTNGDPGREPLTTRPDLAEYVGGAHAFVAAMAALRWRTRGGEGNRIDLSMLDAALSLDDYNFTVTQALGIVRRRYYSRVLLGYPSDIFECRDGHVVLLAGARFSDVPLLIERPELLGDRLITDANHRTVHWRALEEILAPWIRSHDRDEIVARAQELRIAVAPVLGADELLEHPHVVHRGSIQWARGEGDGPAVAITAAPFQLRSHRDVPLAVPSRGEHTAGIVEGIKSIAPRSEWDAPSTSGASPALPLSGVRVLDFSHVWAGPACTRMLADLGAEVIKVEGPSRYDPTRNIFLLDNDARDDFWNRSVYFNARNQNKLSISVDLATEEGRAAIRRLIPSCDVVVENFTPRVMGNLQLAYEDLSELNRRLVMVSLSGYGATGPFANHVALGMSLDGSSGLSSGNGYRDGSPEKSGSAIVDAFAGACAAGAILAALDERAWTGEGQHIDFSQHEAAMSIVGGWIAEYSMSGRLPAPSGNASDRFAPQGLYPCAGDDNWLYLSIHDDGEWQQLCSALGADDLAADASVTTLPQRLAMRDAIDERLASLTAGRDKFELMELLQGCGIIAAAVLDGGEVEQSAHLAERRSFQEVTIGSPPRSVRIPRYVAARFSGFEPRTPGGAPSLGADSARVLAELGGLSEEEIAQLESAGVISGEPVFAFPIEQMREAVTLPVEQWIEMGCAGPLERSPR